MYDKTRKEKLGIEILGENERRKEGEKRNFYFFIEGMKKERKRNSPEDFGVLCRVRKNVL